MEFIPERIAARTGCSCSGGIPRSSIPESRGCDPGHSGILIPATFASFCVQLFQHSTFHMAAAAGGGGGGGGDDVTMALPGPLCVPPVSQVYFCIKFCICICAIAQEYWFFFCPLLCLRILLVMSNYLFTFHVHCADAPVALGQVPTPNRKLCAAG